MSRLGHQPFESEKEKKIVKTNTEKKPVFMYNFVQKTKAWQPCNFDGILYQLRYWIFSHGFHQKIRFQRNFKAAVSR